MENHLPPISISKQHFTCEIVEIELIGSVTIIKPLLSYNLTSLMLM